jgi:hypothetical protein
VTFAPQDNCNWCGQLVDDCERRKKKDMTEKKVLTPVVIESPYAGDVERNLRYLRACMHDCLVNHQEAPYASHALYTQPGVLDDTIPEERQLGIEAGFAFRPLMKKTVVYEDLGYSRGMNYGIKHAEEIGHPIEYRTLGESWDVRPRCDCGACKSCMGM